MQNNLYKYTFPRPERRRTQPFEESGNAPEAAEKRPQREGEDTASRNGAGDPLEADDIN